MAEISPAVQQQIVQFQQIQKQLQIIVQQRMQFEMQLREVESAVKELEEHKEGEVYKTVGNLIIKSTSEKLTSELKEKKETLDVTIKKLKNQEEMYQNRLKELQKDIQAALSAIGASGTGG